MAKIRHPLEPITDSVAWPLVSIITPTYNQGRYIRGTIESILAQDYPYIEYVIIDAGSTDETLAILREYGDRLRWVSEPDRGQSHAINKGFAMTKGEILAWVNSDDLLLPGAVSAAVAAFRKDPRLGLVYGNGRELDGESRFVRDAEAFKPDIWALVHSYDYIIQVASFFRREGFEAVGGLDEDLHWAMDYDLFIRLSLRYRTSHIDYCLAEFRVYDECKTASGGWWRFREIVRIVRRYSPRRFPPAYFHYAWEFVQTSLKRLSLATRIPLCQQMVTVLCHSVERALISRNLRWHSDGWANPVVDLYILNDGDGERVLELTGCIPVEGQINKQQRLKVSINGIVVRERNLQPGEFEMLIAIDRLACGPLIHLRLEASRWFVPGLLGVSNDFRRLAFQLHSVDWTGSKRTRQRESRANGWYSDGWIAPNFSTVLDSNGEAIEILGRLPPELQKLRGQTLVVMVDNEPLAHEELKGGEFRCVVPVPCDGIPFELRLKTSRSVVPADEGLNQDRRELALVLHSVRFLPEIEVSAESSSAARL